ncbi:hypothetical protein A2483_03170 [Candidatus Peregrinibacteria bacterium RIFOXYC2_FULL_33_13]|nr:MAG: hypothetical protein A2483_03170 [Candidatus Peregrinibacteria bacterium RIFOXYC2_FULL_33_13]
MDNGEKTNEKRRLVIEKAGILASDNLQENRQWGGLIHHLMLVCRVAAFYAKKIGVDPSLVVNIILANFLGKRQWRESIQYKEGILNKLPDEKKPKNELETAIQLFDNLELPENIKKISQNWQGLKDCRDDKENKALYCAVYATIRVEQSILKPHQRLAIQFYNRFVNPTDKTPENQEKVIEAFREIINQLQNEYTGDISISKTKMLELLNEKIRKELKINYREKDDQYDIPYIMHGSLLLILDFEKKEIIDRGIDPNEIISNPPKMPNWEQGLRQEHLDAVKDEAFQLLDMLEAEGNQAEIEKQFPENSWWGSEMRRMYKEQISKKAPPDKTLEY